MAEMELEDGLVADEQPLMAVRLKPRPGFVGNGQVQEIAERALFYLNAGYPVHFSGPAGTGKTTLAMHVAASLGRPVMLIHGDDEYGRSDLVGDAMGYSRNKVVDNYIHSVVKTEESMRKQWVDNRLTHACKHGFTLVYDEFTRSKPEANNVLLSILEEKILDLPMEAEKGAYLKVHPDFRAIFTSNPEEYAGVHKTQDAILDRLIAIRLEHYDRRTEILITAARSGCGDEQAARIVDVVREIRQLGVRKHWPTIRACIMMGRLTALRNARVAADDPFFLQICRDVLNIETTKVTRDGKSFVSDELQDYIRKVCGGNGSLSAKRRDEGGGKPSRRNASNLTASPRNEARGVSP